MIFKFSSCFYSRGIIRHLLLCETSCGLFMNGKFILAIICTARFACGFTPRVNPINPHTCLQRRQTKHRLHTNATLLFYFYKPNQIIAKAGEKKLLTELQFAFSANLEKFKTVKFFFLSFGHFGIFFSFRMWRNAASSRGDQHFPEIELPHRDAAVASHPHDNELRGV